MGGRLNPKIGSRTSFWYQFYTIGTNIGLYGLKLSAFILTFRDDSNGSTPEGPDPLFDLNTIQDFFVSDDQ